jgi:hypothetical protein
MNLLIYILATWRMSSLLARESGPWNTFERLRHLLGVRRDDMGNTYTLNKLADGVICTWCNSVWFGALWAALAFVAPWLAFWLALPLALSAGAILVSEVLEWLEQARPRS